MIEMMISSVIILVAVTGFIAMVQHVLAANGAAHRRTVGTFVRGALLDQLSVTPRGVIAALPQNAWYIDECYDFDSRPSGANLLRDPAYVCPDGSGYQRWVRVTPVVGTSRAFRIAVYVERISMGCTVTTDPDRLLRNASDACVSADVFVND
jgi:hypothetical protein